MDWCEWCRADAGRFNANATCCRARGLAMAPADRRQTVYAQLRTVEGADAVAALHAQVQRFKARALAKAPREVRQRAYHDEMIEGLTSGMNLLKDLVKVEYERQKAA